MRTIPVGYGNQIRTPKSGHLSLLFGSQSEKMGILITDQSNLLIKGMWYSESRYLDRLLITCQTL
jgi:hypothetical protein